MTPHEHFRALMRERREYKPGTPEHSWRTRAARKFVWLMRGVPTEQWGAMQ